MAKNVLDFKKRAFGATGSADSFSHFNVGPGIAQDATEGFIFDGDIIEHPLTKTLRAVGELSMQATVSQPPNNSGLLGVIWDTPKSDLALDAAVRRGLSNESPDWLMTTGFSYGFQI